MAAQSDEFYKLEGSAIVGPFPIKPKDHVYHANASESNPLMHGELLNDSEYQQWSNLLFTIRGERVYSHRAIVEIRCPELLATTSIIKRKKEKKNGMLEVEYKNDTYMSKFTLMQILEWCYTGEIDLEALTLQDVQVLLFATDPQHLNIPHLDWMCHEYIRSNLNNDTVFPILKQAECIGLGRIKDVALVHCSRNWGQVITNTKGSEILGLSLFHELTITVQQMKASDLEKKDEQKSPPPNTLHSDFAQILSNQSYCDGEFTAGSEPIRYHKAILGAHSKPLLALLKQKSKNISFPGMDGAAFYNLLEFVYFGKLELDALACVKLLEFAVSQLELEHLRPHAISSVANGITVHTCLPILRITYLPYLETKSESLRKAAIKCVCENFTRIDVHSIRTMDTTKIGFNMMADILEALYGSMGGSHSHQDSHSSKDKEDDGKGKKKKKVHTSTSKSEESEESSKKDKKSSTASRGSKTPDKSAPKSDKKKSTRTHSKKELKKEMKEI